VASRVASGGNKEGAEHPTEVIPMIPTTQFRKDFMGDLPLYEWTTEM
jgi:hypothetical protein